MQSGTIQIMTKNLFATALKNKVKKKPIDKITIRELAEECGLSRRTFYRHFKDIYDLLEWSYQTEIKNKIIEYIDFDHWKVGLIDMFKYFYDNKEVSYSIMKFSDRRYLEKFLNGTIEEVVLPIIEKEGLEVNLQEDKKKFLCDYYSLSFTAILIQWIEKGMKEDPEEIVENIWKILNGSILRISK